MKEQNQFQLLRQRRFAPYFLTQLLGAFNDNVYKNALVALIAFSAARQAGTGDSINDGLMINLAAGLFILPFFLFSAFAGQVADKFEKSALIRQIKLAEILIMGLGIVAFAVQSLPLQMGTLFLMGVQSTFFGPIKYGILPQHLSEQELIGGNGLVELGTFLAILLGTIAGTQLIARSADGSVWPVAVVLLLVAVAGWFCSRAIPTAPANDPSLNVRFNPMIETVRLVKETAKLRVIFQSILGISWFWFLGATYLAQFPVYARDVLGGSVDVFTLLLAVFSIGIGLGSGLCERLSGSKVEIGLVPFGAIGITLFGLDLVFASPSEPLGVDLAALSFLAAAGAWRIVADIFLIGLFGGFYIVPLYALIQTTSAPERLSRAIACNNIINAFLMVLSAVVALLLINFGASIAQIFLVVAIMNAVVAAYIFRLVPEFLMRFLIWILINTLYRVRAKGLQHIPEKGPAVLIANHVSFVDALIIAGCVRRPIRFVMYHGIFRIPILNFVFRTAKAIPIAGRRENAELYEAAFVSMRKALDDGDLLCLFPEGGITYDGEMQEFKPGILKILEDKPVPTDGLAGLVGQSVQSQWWSCFFQAAAQALRSNCAGIG